ncbi:hypothetical protein [Actinopolymorpha alba]|uniref:hypothetical protein n=1 Tax=Actinopolymorpha alba TaxID=533267 RepID=UPI0003A160B0|nr:hypothetical protein [Actinopolymorpha alba]
MGNVEIDESVVRSLLREQHPDLAGLSLRQVAAGWDNQLWRLGEELAVRLPRTARPGSSTEGAKVAARPGPAPPAPGADPRADR